jgi:hypothetical protein
MHVSEASPQWSVLRAASVVGEAGKQPGQLLNVGLVEVMSQALVEPHRRLAQAEEQGVASGAGFDDVDPPIVRVAAAGEQSGLLHGVEVVGERGFADPDGCGQFALVHLRVDLEVEEDEPHRERATGCCERLIEGAAHHPGDPGELKADWDFCRTHAQKPSTD